MFEINFISPQGHTIRAQRRLLIILFFILLLTTVYFFLVRNRAPVVDTQKQNIGRIENVILSTVSEGDIRLLGVVIDENNQWALVTAKNQAIVRIQKGDLLGKERMRVEKITLDSIVLFSKTFGQKILKDKNSEKTTIN